MHHVAFRTPDAEYDAWAERLNKLRVPNSGKVDRFWFRSLYFREPNGILFEIASDGPGFGVDEPMDKLGEKLVLPPFLEARRAEIEAGLKAIVSRCLLGRRECACEPSRSDRTSRLILRTRAFAMRDREGWRTLDAGLASASLRDAPRLG